MLRTPGLCISRGKGKMSDKKKGIEAMVGRVSARDKAWSMLPAGLSKETVSRLQREAGLPMSVWAKTLRGDRGRGVRVMGLRAGKGRQSAGLDMPGFRPKFSFSFSEE